jgi:hypothetical protein
MALRKDGGRSWAVDEGATLVCLEALALQQA